MCISVTTEVNYVESHSGDSGEITQFRPLLRFIPERNVQRVLLRIPANIGSTNVILKNDLVKVRDL